MDTGGTLTPDTGRSFSSTDASSAGSFDFGDIEQRMDFDLAPFHEPFAEPDIFYGYDGMHHPGPNILRRTEFNQEHRVGQSGLYNNITDRPSARHPAIRYASDTFTGERFHTWEDLVADPVKIGLRMPISSMGVNPMSTLDNGPFMPEEAGLSTIKEEEQEDEYGILTQTQNMAPVALDSSIPLLCVACPKKQKFSDISHLLTHINSKGHLHSHQLLKIRALSDASASNALQQYDQWYEDHGIEYLLAERLAQRDQKEAARKRKTGDDSGNTPKKAKTVKNTTRLERDEITLAHRPKTPVSHSSGRDYTSNRIQTPSLHRNSSHSFVDSPVGSTFLPASPASYGDSVGRPSLPKGSVDAYDELPRLKGVCWPGMNMFDAATEEMKRMRNQRKHQSVIDQMEAFSATISRDEFVYNLDFDLERVRDVYDSPSVASSPSPKLGTKRNGRKTRATRAVDDDDEGIPGMHSRMMGRNTLDVFNDGSGTGQFTPSQHTPSQREEALPPLTSAGLGAVRPMPSESRGNGNLPLRHRLPLQTLGTNATLATANSTTKHHARLGEPGKENPHSGFIFPQTGDNEHLFGSGASFIHNPLCFPSDDVNFNPFASSMSNGYRSDIAVSHTSFRPINGVGQQAMLSHYLSQGGRETLAGQPDEESFYEASV